jgi:hypothetical protein
MLDYCLALYCSFDPTKPNQAGMIVFNGEITTFIPLGLYSQDQWSAQVETVRATRGTPNEACCSCCTPTADAFDAAGEEFAIRGLNDIRIAFMITDGVPSNNNANTGGNPAWWFYNPTKGFNPATYNYKIVPERASVLKLAGNRVFLVGVPDKDGVPPRQAYFSGGIPSGTKECVVRESVKFCSTYEIPPFPIVSLPVDKNSFSTKNWNVQGLITQTVGALCEIPPTPAPTKSPTTPPPTLPPTREPTPPPTTPTKAPTKAPTKNPTNNPTNPPTQSPTSIVLEQVDMTFIIDRSNSMNWHDAACKAIAMSTPRDDGIEPKSYCWELFMRYVLEQADALVKVQAGENKNRDLGWYDDFPVGSTPAKGLRVNLVGFACENNQRTPRMFPFSKDMAGGPITNREQLRSLLDELRQTILPDGGTCPGLAIEQAVRYVEATDAAVFPLQSAILVTDGVFYDMPFPEKAVTGLAAYKALRFAVGIAVADAQYTYGLTKEEIATQRQQLHAFVGGNKDLFFNFGAEGWGVLSQVATGIAQRLPLYYFQGTPIPRYTWCGWRRLQSCSSDGYRMGKCTWPSKKNVKQWGCQKA